MSLQELHSKLIELRIPEERYYLHGLYGSADDNDKLALIIKKGIRGIEYEVYIKEKGEKHSVKIFLTEDEACQYFYKRLKEIEDIYNRN